MPKKPPWNDRVRYVGDPERERLHLQSEFLAILRAECPDVLNDLGATVLPLWRVASSTLRGFAEEWKEKATKELSPYSGCLNPYEAATQVSSHSQVPECRAARSALEAWLKKNNLVAGGVWDWAAATLRGWVVSEANLPEGQLPQLFFAPLYPGPLERAPSEPIVAWDPQNEALGEFRKRVNRHVRQQQTWAREQGLRPVRESRSRSGRTLRDRLAWVVLHRVLAWSYEAIAAKEKDLDRAIPHGSSVRESVVAL